MTVRALMLFGADHGSVIEFCDSVELRESLAMYNSIPRMGVSTFLLCQELPTNSANVQYAFVLPKHANSAQELLREYPPREYHLLLRPRSRLATGPTARDRIEPVTVAVIEKIMRHKP